MENVKRKWVAECICGATITGAQSFTEQQFVGAARRGGWAEARAAETKDGPRVSVLVCPACVASFAKAEQRKAAESELSDEQRSILETARQAG